MVSAERSRPGQPSPVSQAPGPPVGATPDRQGSQAPGPPVGATPDRQGSQAPGPPGGATPDRQGSGDGPSRPGPVALEQSFDFDTLYALRSAVAAHAADLGAAGDALSHLLIIAGELVGNAVRH